MLGTWHIYSQTIGANTLNTTPDSVTIQADGAGFKTAGNFPLTGEPVTFTQAGTHKVYYLGHSTNYLYRIQTLTSGGLTHLIGHVANKVAPGSDPTQRAAFAGLHQVKGILQDVDSIPDISAAYIHLEHSNNTEHQDGLITIIRRPPIGLISAMVPGFGMKNFTINKDETTTDDDIHLVTDPLITGQKKEILEAKIVFTQNRHPVYIGYHWREAGFNTGSPASQYCTRVTIGW